MDKDGTDSPVAVKVEGHSRCIILRYFRGDIGSMVDAHFSRALSKVCKANTPAGKATKIRQTIKLEESSSCQANGAEPLPVSGCHMTFKAMDDPCRPWPSFIGRTREEACGLPSGAYAMSPEDLSLTGQQYATSLLNLLHSDRSEMGPCVASSSKTEVVPSWMVPQGFRDSVEPAVGFESGRLDKKDLYWY